MQDCLTKLSADIYLIKNLSVKVNLNPLNSVMLASTSQAQKISKTEWELLTDVNMTVDCKNGIRRGIERAIC